MTPWEVLVLHPSFLLKFDLVIEKKNILIYFFFCGKYVRIEASLGYGMVASGMGVTGVVVRRCVEGFKAGGGLGRWEEGCV